MSDVPDAVALRERLASGELSCTEVAESFLAAVGEDPLHAWAVIDADAVRAQAASLDALAPAERDALPLFGIPVGIKDNFETADLPTAYGSPIYEGFRPADDAIAVRRLRESGALIAGKLKCAEFAWMTPPDTLNPLDVERTPGGSSTGSAVAVAAGQVPLATGTQTAGSINRPASYCGVLGYKPTFGLYPRKGIKLLASSLDTVGMLGRTIRDLELAAGLLAGAGSPDPERRRAPRLVFARTKLWPEVSEEAQEASEQLVASARESGVTIDDLTLTPRFDVLAEAQTTIQMYESALSLGYERRSKPELLSDELRATLEVAAAIPGEDYARAKRNAEELGPPLARLLERYDGVLTPSTTGVPPLGLGFTGDPLFCRVWTLIGAPCISLAAGVDA